LFAVLSIWNKVDDLRRHMPAVNIIEHAALHHPQTYRPQLNASAVALRQGDFASALRYGQRAHALRPARPKALVNCMSAAARLGAWRLALTYSIELFPNLPDQRIADNIIAFAEVLGEDDLVTEYTRLKPTLKPRLEPIEPSDH
jgi:Tfp pilus assembly protein PilF